MDKIIAEKNTVKYFSHPAEYGQPISCRCVGFSTEENTKNPFAILKCETPDNKYILAVYSDDFGTFSKHGIFDERTAEEDGRKLCKTVRDYWKARAKEIK